MRAVVYESFGAPDQLRVHEVPIPSPGKGEFLIRVAGSSVNPVDWKMRRGDLRLLVRRRFPIIPGFDLAGTVEEPGPETHRFRRGDRVMALLPAQGRIGATAEFVVVPEVLLAPAPASLSLLEAATLPLAGLTALQALRDHGRLTAGQSVLINGGSGGVGVFAVQIAKAMGARVVATCGPDNLQLVQELGADEAINYQEKDFTRRDDRFDVVFDAVATRSFREAARVMTRDGRFVTTLPSPGVLLRMLVQPLGALFGLRRRARFFLVKPRSSDLEFLTQLVEAGKIRPVIDQVFPLENIVPAHELSEHGHVRGKIAIRIHDEPDNPSQEPSGH